MSVRSLSLSLPLLAAFALVGCSSSDSKSGPPGEPDGGDTTPETYLGLEVPADGFQVRNVGATIPPGADQEFCEVAELPGDPSTTYFVGGIDIANGEGSHHLILNAAPPGGTADAKLREMDIGERVPCVAAEMAFGTDLVGIGGVQTPRGEIRHLEGLAQKYFGGQRVVFDYHYYNTTDCPIEARSAFNFHLVDGDTVKQLVGGIGFFNWTIDTPPGETRTFTADCRFQTDAIVGASPGTPTSSAGISRRGSPGARATARRSGRPPTTRRQPITASKSRCSCAPAKASSSAAPSRTRSRAVSASA